MRRHVINALAASALVSVIASGCAGGGDATDGVAPDAGDDGSVSGSSSGGGSGSGSGGSSGGGSGGGAVDSGGIDAAGIDAGALQTCVHTDDCKPPAAMCQGNNGVACLGGFCVPTGHPMSCDDGIACTDDFCDANANACTHKPDDAACPNGSYCDPTLNCVQTLPCTPGDAVCDRLDTGACNGLWTCDPTAKHCVHGAKPCPDRPNATTTCAPSGGLDGGVVADAGAASAECAWACAPSFVDLDGDLENPVGAPSDGCECTITNAVDVPDLGFVDSNCDGIDGDVTKAIFVDGASGKDSNPGTMAAPMKTVGAGLAAAASASPKKSVYVSKGSYDEGTLTLLDGVSLYGGYDAASHWSRANDFAHTTTIASTSNVAVLGKGLGGALELQLFAITAQGGAAPGDSSYGVKLVNASGGVTLRALTITPGPGANAGPAQSGGTAADGVTGNDAKGTAHGGDLGSSCNAGSGGAGGDGVCGETDGNPGILGGTATLGGAQGASPGTGGGKGHCPFIGTSGPGAPGNTPLQPGQSGGPGANGNPGGAVGSFDSASGDYSPATGGAGVAGNPGGGGAGGGAGGGSASHDPISCNNHCSGGGGGGGTGGCGGNPGLGGLGGGGSFAVVMLGSQVLLDQCKLNPGAGGTGSNGGDGGQGGKGGPGGKAGGADGNAGSGAPGGAGGSGGRGGGGAGGPGGPSVCVGYKGSPPAGTSAYVCNLSGSTSGGGQGGTGGLGRAASGPSGVQADKQQGQ